MSRPFLGRANALALEESDDWQPFGLPFALVLGHACPVVLLSPVLYVCTVRIFMLG